MERKLNTTIKKFAIKHRVVLCFKIYPIFHFRLFNLRSVFFLDVKTDDAVVLKTDKGNDEDVSTKALVATVDILVEDDVAVAAVVSKFHFNS